MQAAWKVDLSGNPFMEFHAKLKNVKRVLAELSKQAFGDIFLKVTTLGDVISAKESQLEINPIPENRQEL